MAVWNWLFGFALKKTEDMFAERGRHWLLLLAFSSFLDTTQQENTKRKNKDFGGCHVNISLKALE